MQESTTCGMRDNDPYRVCFRSKKDDPKDVEVRVAEIESAKRSGREFTPPPA